MLSVIFAALGLTAAASYAQTYSLTDIGTIGGLEIQGLAINNSGQITGSFRKTNGRSCIPLLEALLHLLMIVALPTPAGWTSSYGLAINDSGLITGGYEDPNVMTTGLLDPAFLYTPAIGPSEPATMIVLPWFQPIGVPFGTGINNSGQIIGSLYSGPTSAGFVYTPGVGSTPLPTLAGWPTGDSAYGINNSGQVTGTLFGDSMFSVSAFLYTPAGGPSAPATMIPLPTLAGWAGSYGYAINDAGQVTGAFLYGPTCSAGACQQNTFVYSPAGAPSAPATIMPLPMSNGSSWSLPFSINISGEITGEFLDDNHNLRAFVYSPILPATVSDLNLLVDSNTPLPVNVTLVVAPGINDRGWIVANGSNNHVYLLKPVSTSNPPNCTPTPVDKYHICLRPTICGSNGSYFCYSAACAVPGCSNTLINWTSPVIGGGDPWLYSVSLKILLGTFEQARSVAAGLQVTVSTKAQVQTVSERNTIAELIDHGALRQHSVLIVGPSVNVTETHAESAAVKSLATSKTDQIVELSIPYDATTFLPGTSLRMVRFDKSKDRWIDIADQYVTVSKHLITAHVLAVGRYTVVADMSRTHTRWSSRLSVWRTDPKH